MSVEFHPIAQEFLTLIEQYRDTELTISNILMTISTRLIFWNNYPSKENQQNYNSQMKEYLTQVNGYIEKITQFITKTNELKTLLENEPRHSNYFKDVLKDMSNFIKVLNDLIETLKTVKNSIESIGKGI